MTDAINPAYHELTVTKVLYTSKDATKTGFSIDTQLAVSRDYWEILHSCMELLLRRDDGLEAIIDEFTSNLRKGDIKSFQFDTAFLIIVEQFRVSISPYPTFWDWYEFHTPKNWLSHPHHYQLSKIASLSAAMSAERRIQLALMQKMVEKKRKGESFLSKFARRIGKGKL